MKDFITQVVFNLLPGNDRDAKLTRSKLMLPSHSDDRWGIAYFKYDLSTDLVNGLAEDPFNILLGPEEGVEVFYNWAVTPWFRVTADVQWIDAIPGDFEDAAFAGPRTEVTF